MRLDDRPRHRRSRPTRSKSHHRCLSGRQDAPCPICRSSPSSASTVAVLRDKSHKAILDFLNRHPKDKHILVAAANDTSAMGAIQPPSANSAAKSMSSSLARIASTKCCARCSVPGSPVPSAPSRTKCSYTVPRLIDLGLSPCCAGKQYAPYNYVEHRVVTPDQASHAFIDSATVYGCRPLSLHQVQESASPRTDPQKETRKIEEIHTEELAATMNRGSLHHLGTS